MSFGIDHDQLLATLAGLPHKRELVFRDLPTILRGQGEGHTTVTVPMGGQLRIAGSSEPRLKVGAVISAAGVVGRAARERKPVYLTDTSADPDYFPAVGPGFPVELALPILERGEVVAILNIERHEPFTEAELCTLQLFTTSLSQRLTEKSHSLEATINAELSLRLDRTGDAEGMAAVALEVLMPLLAAQEGVLLMERRGELVAVAAGGPEGPVPASTCDPRLLHPDGPANRTLFRGQPLVDEADGSGATTVTLPVRRHGDPSRWVLSLRFGRGQLSAGDLAMLVRVCRHLALLLESAAERKAQDALLALHVSIQESGTEDLYGRILEAAIEHVPGAEAGSLLVRNDPEGPFRYRALGGFDEALLRIEYTEDDMLAWYATDRAAWLSGSLRVLTRSDRDLDAFSRLAGGQDAPADAGSLEWMESTLCLPVVYRGQVLAALNLDNFQREDAFGRDSRRILAQFAPAVAGLLATAHFRDDIVRLSLTDPVTGLPNRRAALDELARQLAAADRSGGPMTLLMMDLTGFKAVNDRLGHEAGDEVLAQVASALSRTSRAGDFVGRWGGDEFVALLPATPASEAAALAARFEGAAAASAALECPLAIDIGAAGYPGDASDPEALVALADERMYEVKERRRRVRRARRRPRPGRASHDPRSNPESPA